jgi:Bacteriophage baseplate protein W
MSQEFVGAGWSFPLRTGPGGDVTLLTRDKEIEEAMRLILGTAHMERPMRPEFGCGIHDFVFEAADSTALGRIAYEVRVALERWEPRVEIVDVAARVHDSARETVQIDVRYRVKGSNDPRNLVFPFYVIPHEEPDDGLTAGGAL